MNQRELRLLFVVAGAVVFFDTVFYAAVVPLLPTLTRQLHLTKASAGVLTAAYAAGTLVGSLPGGMLAERAGPRVTLYTGLALMGGSSLAFGLLHNVALLDVARFIQGVGGACTWAGSMVWLIIESPPERGWGAGRCSRRSCWSPPVWPSRSRCSPGRPRRSSTRTARPCCASSASRPSCSACGWSCFPPSPPER